MSGALSRPSAPSSQHAGTSASKACRADHTPPTYKKIRYTGTCCFDAISVKQIISLPQKAKFWRHFPEFRCHKALLFGLNFQPRVYAIFQQFVATKRGFHIIFQQFLTTKRWFHIIFHFHKKLFPVTLQQLVLTKKVFPHNFLKIRCHKTSC